MRSFDLSFFRHFRHVYFLRITSGMENRDALRTQSASMFTGDFTRGLAHQDQKPGVRGAAADIRRTREDRDAGRLSIRFNGSIAVHCRIY